jgi:hypothetical protein
VGRGNPQVCSEHFEERSLRDAEKAADPDRRDVAPFGAVVGGIAAQTEKLPGFFNGEN